MMGVAFASPFDHSRASPRFGHPDAEQVNAGQVRPWRPCRYLALDVQPIGDLSAFADQISQDNPVG